MTPTQFTASFDGFRLASWRRQAEDGGSRFLLLVHGGASNHTRWSEFVDTTSLTRQWTMLCPDMRGNGASMTRGRQDLELWCADLRDLLAAEGAESAVLVGHSLGANIALRFADLYPDRTMGLVLIDPLFRNALKGRQLRIYRLRWLLWALAGGVRALNALGLYRRQIEDRDLRELDAETRAAIGNDVSFQEIARRYGALGPILKHMPTANYLRQSLESFRPLPAPDGIAVPVLALLSGGTTLSHLDITRAEIERFPDGELHVLEANHWPITETPDAVREAIDDWVSRRFAESC